MSPTPILDRLAPLPPAVRPRSGMTIVFVVWSAVLLALAIAVSQGQPPILRRWLFDVVPNWIRLHGTGRAILLMAGTTIVVSLAMVAVHEGGHLLGGLIMGYRFKAIRVGPIQFDRASGLSLQGGLANAFSGVATVVPKTSKGLIPSGIVLLSGGPCANLFSGILVLLLPISHGLASALFIVQSIANGLSDLLPYRNSLGVSDGAFLWALFRHPAHAERWLSIMRLRSDTADGVLPESLLTEFLNKATAIRDASADTVIANAFAFSNAFHQHRDADAGRFLETCLAYSGHAPVPLREALMSEAAVFQARRYHQADVAEQWLADIPKAPRFPWIRPRVEAAILEAKGDIPAAIAKLEECERAVTASAAAPQRDYLLRLFRRWKSELSTDDVSLRVSAPPRELIVEHGSN